MKIAEHLASSEIQPGMTLFDPLFDEGGHLLLPPGCSLSEGILADLRRRRIAELAIVRVVDEEIIAQATPQESVVKSLAPLFRKAGSGPASRQFYRSILRYQMEQAR